MGQALIRRKGLKGEMPNTSIVTTKIVGRAKSSAYFNSDTVISPEANPLQAQFVIATISALLWKSGSGRPAMANHAVLSEVFQRLANRSRVDSAHRLTNDYRGVQGVRSLFVIFG
jgi:hypothetical protein